MEKRRLDAEMVTRADLDRAINKMYSALQLVTVKKSGGGGPDGKALVAMLNTYLGSTAWQSGSAAEIVAALEELDPSVGTIAVTDGAPGDNTASTVVIGQKDSSVGTKATLDIETEEVVVTEACVADSSLAVWVNGVEYKIGLLAVT